MFGAEAEVEQDVGMTLPGVAVVSCFGKECSW